MKIKNFDQLAQTPNREAALVIAEAGLQAIDTKRVVQQSVRLEGGSLYIKEQPFSLKEIDRVFVVGAGKCALEAGASLEEILGERLTAGIIIDVHEGSLNKIKAYTGDHPFPSQKNINITKEIISLLSEAKERDLIIFIISGGGSALLCQPHDLTCSEEKEIVDSLFRGGATITEVNTIRKHISSARGGHLASHAYPAQSLALIFSDIPDDRLEFVASGPTFRDTTTLEDAEKVIEKYKLEEKHGRPIALIETPKEEKYFERVTNTLLASNQDALTAMQEKAEALGWSVSIATSTLSGEAKDVGIEITKNLHTLGPKQILLYGGETTVTLNESQGKGGRNLELVLAALSEIKEGELILSLASDGRDNSEFAGALCDIMTSKQATQKNIDPASHLKEHRSYEFFSEVGDWLSTGDTGSNVSDIIIALKS